MGFEVSISDFCNGYVGASITEWYDSYKGEPPDIAGIIAFWEPLYLTAIMGYNSLHT